MNLPSTILFAVIFLAFSYTFFHLLKKVYLILKNDADNSGETGCSCCSSKCSHCSDCGKTN